MNTSAVLSLGQAPTEPVSSGQFVVWALICLALALVLFFVEVFIPSGGVIGLASAVLLVAGIVMLFQFNTLLGLIGAVVALVAVPFLFAFALRLWPNTPIARFLQLRDVNRQSDHDSAHRDQKSSDEAAQHDEQLLGQQGKALTDLRPVGTCLIGDRRVECLAERGVIQSGSAVRVIFADGMSTKVRADSDSEP